MTKKPLADEERRIRQDVIPIPGYSDPTFDSDDVRFLLATIDALRAELEKARLTNNGLTRFVDVKRERDEAREQLAATEAALERVRGALAHLLADAEAGRYAGPRALRRALDATQIPPKPQGKTKKEKSQ